MTVERGPLFADGPHADVDVMVRATVRTLWPLISDIALPARFSAEFQGAEWLDEPDVVGARFRGHNENEFMGQWSAVCTVVQRREPTRFGWVVGDPAQPSATWTFELSEHGAKTLLQQRVRLGPGRSGLTAAIAERPDREQKIIAWRLTDLRSNMLATVSGIKELAEAPELP